MSRTIRHQNPKTVHNAFTWDARKRHMLLKGVKAFRSDKCMDATVDREGNAKLNTWSETPQKVGSLANRKMRRVAKVQIARQLEDA